MIIRLKLNDDWSAVAKLLRETYPFLSETDLLLARGGEAALVERLALRMKLPQEEVYSILMKLKLEAAGRAPLVA